MFQLPGLSLDESYLVAKEKPIDYALIPYLGHAAEDRITRIKFFVSISGPLYGITCNHFSRNFLRILQR
jgi:hypothetical protein